MTAELTHRITFQGNVQGFVIRFSDGSEKRMRYYDIIQGIKDGSLDIVNAKIQVATSYGTECLKGIRTSLQRLPQIKVKEDDPIIKRC